MTTKKYFFARTILIIFLSCALAAPVSGAELPRAQLDESERHFTEAYRRLLARDNWGALEYLERALKANTYLVDYYIMKGLVMNRIGDFGAGRGALEHYLEVRPMDMTAPRILSYAIAQQRTLQRIVSPSAFSVQWRVSGVDLQNEFDLGHVRAFNTRGLGKAGMWGKSLYLADTLGDRVFFRKGTSRGVSALRVDRPVAVLPMGDDSFYIVTAGGEVHYLGAFADDPTPLLPDLRGFLENTSIADAAMISSNEFVVADSAARAIAFYSLATLTGAPADDGVMSSPAARTGAWSPPDGEEAFFEPVAAAPYGKWLAVADRGGDKIYFLDLGNRREFFHADLPRPRDVSWSMFGELFAINEDGDLFKISADFRDNRVEAIDKLESGITNGWALFSSPDGDVYCMDIAGSRLWKAVPVPDPAMSMGILSAGSPSISREENRESFLLDAILMSPFKTYSKTPVLVAHAVWNNRAIPAVAEWNERSGARKAESVLFNRHAPSGAVNPNIRNVTVETGADLRAVLPTVWSYHGGALTNLIIDSTVDMTQEDLNVIALFCLNNGLQMDVWARSVPSVELIRAAGITGGKALFSLINQPDLSAPHSRMRIRIPLPQELSSSGYPSRSMLSLFLDVGFIQTRDWIPLWPDMLE